MRNPTTVVSGTGDEVHTTRSGSSDLPTVRQHFAELRARTDSQAPGLDTRARQALLLVAPLARRLFVRNLLRRLGIWLVGHFDAGRRRLAIGALAVAGGSAELARLLRLQTCMPRTQPARLRHPATLPP